MLSRLAALVLLPVTLSATDLWLRTPGTGICRVNGATSANPIHMSVVSASACGLTNGAFIIVAEIGGNLTANIHMVSAANTADRVRKVANLVGNEFDLQDENGNPVDGTGAGTYTNGGRLGLATKYTLRDHPFIFLDGPGGPLTLSVSNSSAGGRAHPGWLPYDYLVASTDAWLAANPDRTKWGIEGMNTGSDYWSLALNLSMRWLADGHTASRDAALALMDNVDQYAGTNSCDEGISQCGTTGTSIADYASLFLFNAAQFYSNMNAVASPTQKANFLKYFLQGRSWTQGGFGYTSQPGLSMPTWKVRAPNATYGAFGHVTMSGTAVTGNSGTAFLSTAAVGDIILIPHSTRSVLAKTHKILAVNSDNSLTVTPGGSWSTNDGYQIGRGWDANTQYGIFDLVRHFDNAILCGGHPASPARDCIANYGPNAGLYQTGDGNHQQTMTFNSFLMGLAGCHTEPYACLIASAHHEYWVDIVVPVILSSYSGINMSTPGYAAGRTWGPMMGMDIVTKASTTAGVTYLPPDLVAKGAEWARSQYFPGTSTHTPTAEHGNYALTADTSWPGLMAIARDATSAASKAMHDWFTTILGYTSGYVRGNGGSYVSKHFLLYDPAVVGARGSTTVLMNRTWYTDCVAIFGASECYPDIARYFSNSRSDWTTNATYVGVSGESYWFGDHGLPDIIGGHYYLSKGTYGQVGGGSIVPSGSGGDVMSANRMDRPITIIGADDSQLVAWPSKANTIAVRSAGNDSYMAVGYNITGSYKPGANVTTAEMQVFHLKKAGVQDYVVDIRRMVGSSPLDIRGLQRYPLENCGTSSSTTCVTLDRANKTGTLRHTGTTKLISKVVGLNGSAVRAQTQNNSDTDGSYTGGRPTGLNAVFGWYVCPDSGSACTTASTLEWAVVQQPSLDTGTPATITSSMSGSWRVIDIADSGAPKLLAVAPLSTNTATSASLTVAIAGTQVTVAGLLEGTYGFSVGGSPVSGCETVPVVTGGHTAVCDTVPAGALTVTLTSAGGTTSGVRGARVRGARVR